MMAGFLKRLQRLFVAVLNEAPHIIWEGEFTISHCTIRGFIWSNGRRSLYEYDVMEWLKLAVPPSNEDLMTLSKFCRGDWTPK